MVPRRLCLLLLLLAARIYGSNLPPTIWTPSPALVSHQVESLFGREEGDAVEGIHGLGRDAAHTSRDGPPPCVFSPNPNPGTNPNLPSAWQTLLENTPTPLSFTVSDPDLHSTYDASLHCTITTSVGTLSFKRNNYAANYASGLTCYNLGTPVACPAPLTELSSYELRGGLAELNEALALLQYTPPAHFSGAATVTVVADDQGFTGGASNSVTLALPVTVQAVDTAPEITATSTAVSYEEDESFALSVLGLQVADYDLASPTADSTEVYELTVTAKDGTVNGASSQTVQATLADLNSATFGGLIYQPKQNSNVFNSGRDTLTFTVKDSTPLTTQLLIYVSQAAVNDPPLVQHGTYATVEGTPLAFSDLYVVDPDAEDVPDAYLSMTVSCADESAALAVVSAGGVYLTSPTPNVLRMSGSASKLNAALATLSYSPTPNYHGTDSVTVTVDDNGNHGSGGEPAAGRRSRAAAILPRH